MDSFRGVRRENLSMSDTVSKGNRLQVLARKLLEADGYVVHTAVRSVQRRCPLWISQTTDIFNALDLIRARIAGPRPLPVRPGTRGRASPPIYQGRPVAR